MKATNAKRKSVLVLLLLILPFALFGQGCLIGPGNGFEFEERQERTDENPTQHVITDGALEIRWKFDSQNICPKDVDTVRIDLQRKSNQRTLSKTLQCENGSLSFDQIPRGIYHLRMEALDQDNNVVWNATPQDIKILADKKLTIVSNLQEISGELSVRWSFEGEFICPIDVEDVVLELKDQAGQKVQSDEIVDCETGEINISNLKPGIYKVTLFGIDDDEITWESSQQTIRVLPNGTTKTLIDLQVSI